MGYNENDLRYGGPAKKLIPADSAKADGFPKTKQWALSVASCFLSPFVLAGGAVFIFIGLCKPYNFEKDLDKLRAAYLISVACGFVIGLGEGFVAYQYAPKFLPNWLVGGSGFLTNAFLGQSAVYNLLCDLLFAEQIGNKLVRKIFINEKDGDKTELSSKMKAATAFSLIMCVSAGVSFAFLSQHAVFTALIAVFSVSPPVALAISVFCAVVVGVVLTGIYYQDIVRRVKLLSKEKLNDFFGQGAAKVVMKLVFGAIVMVAALMVSYAMGATFDDTMKKTLGAASRVVAIVTAVVNTMYTWINLKKCSMFIVGTLCKFKESCRNAKKMIVDDTGNWLVIIARFVGCLLGLACVALNGIGQGGVCEAAPVVSAYANIFGQKATAILTRIASVFQSTSSDVMNVPPVVNAIYGPSTARP